MKNPVQLKQIAPWCLEKPPMPRNSIPDFPSNIIGKEGIYKHLVSHL